MLPCTRTLSVRVAQQETAQLLRATCCQITSLILKHGRMLFRLIQCSFKNIYLIFIQPNNKVSWIDTNDSWRALLQFCPSINSCTLWKLFSLSLLFHVASEFEFQTSKPLQHVGSLLIFLVCKDLWHVLVVRHLTGEHYHTEKVMISSKTVCWSFTCTISPNYPCIYKNFKLRNCAEHSPWFIVNRGLSLHHLQLLQKL